MTREIDYRENDGIHIGLLWNSDAPESVIIHVEDKRTDEIFAFVAPGEDAREAFEHPYAYRYRETALALT